MRAAIVPAMASRNSKCNRVISNLPLTVCALACGCIGVSQKRSAGNGVVGGNVADLNVCPAGLRPGDDGAIDDFEDGNNQVNLEGGREGYWWQAKDEKGSTIGPTPFAPSDGGAGGSAMALRATGTTLAGNTTDGFWGAEFGFNFAGKGPYDASKYVGIAFKARVAPGASRTARFNIGDINTHKDGNICQTCWNHFGKVLSLTPEWKEYRILFTDVRQEDGWGNPRPAAITPAKLFNGEFKFGPGQTVDFWVDDLYLLACK
jgi:Carbohydrate binding domain (family 11)